MSTANRSCTNHLELDPTTAATLQAFARRRRWLIVLRCIAITVVAFIAALIAVAIADYLWLLPDAVRMTLTLAAYLVTATVLWFFGLRHLHHDDPQELARQFETNAPTVRDDLLSAVELANPEFANGSPELQSRLQNSVGRRLQKIDIRGLLPITMIRKWLVSGVVVIVVCVLLMLIPSFQFGRRLARAMLPIASIERASKVQLTIVEPAPPTQYVAEGDAVAVVVAVTVPGPEQLRSSQSDTSGAYSDEVLLQWVVENESFETPMLARTARFVADSDDSTQVTDSGSRPNVFAANLSIKNKPVQYRVLSGDAVTLWHTLTPLPRPRVASFEKRYEFPEYAALEDITETADHGDLTAIAGTMAHLTVRFDQPVHSPVLRYGNKGVSLDLQPLAADEMTFTVALPIQTPGNYQIDAISIESQLDNPFSPQYSITPILDGPPVVRWGEEVKATSLASPLDVLALSASIEDDLPIEQVFLEFVINGSEPSKFEIDIQSAAKTLSPLWNWDLMQRNDAPSQAQALVQNDILQLRVVALDRKGQRGESRVVEVLIVDEGFSQSRQDHLDVLHDIVGDTVGWLSDAQTLIAGLRKFASETESNDLPKATRESLRDSAVTLGEEKDQLLERIKAGLPQSQNPVEATCLERVGLCVIDLQSKIDGAVASFTEASPTPDDAPDDTANRARREQLSQIDKQLGNADTQCSRVDEFARSLLAHHSNVGVLTDAVALLRSVNPIAEEGSSVAIELYKRYVNVAIARMKTIDALIDRHQTLMPEAHRKHLGNWDDFSSLWQIRLGNTIEDPPGKDNLRALMRQYADELRSRVQSNIVDQRLGGQLNRLLRELDDRRQAAEEQLRSANQDGRTANKLSQELESIDDANQAIATTRQWKEKQSAYEFTVADVLSRLGQEEALHRTRPIVDLRYAADITLFRRAVENVTSDGYVDYKEEPIGEVHEKLAAAFALIHAAHEVPLLRTELESLRLAENRLEFYAEARIESPLWIERFVSGLDTATKRLRAAGVPSSIANDLGRCATSDSIRQASERIRQRRWDEKAIVSTSVWLRSALVELDAAIEPLTPLVEEARNVILRYVPTITEQAHQAAEKAAAAEQRIKQRENASPETTETLAEQQQDAEQAASDTLQALADRANNVDLTNAQERALARDADAASAQIADALKRAQQQMDTAASAAAEAARSERLDQTAQALADLKDALQQTAEHFERADERADVTASREQLRAAERELQIAEELQRQFEQAESLANAANQSPQELMRQLERELKRNALMQQELSEIATNAAQSAAATLQQAAQSERQINKSLERSDPKIQEQKKLMQQEMSAIADKIDSVRNSLLNPSERAANLGKQPQLRKEVAQLQKDLETAARTAREPSYGDPLMSDLHQSSKQASQAIESSKQAIEQAEKLAKTAAAEVFSDNKQQLQNLQRQASQLQKESRDRRAQDASRLRGQWDKAENEAKARGREAMQQKREAERLQSNAQKELAKNKDNAGQQQQLARAEERIAMAKSAVDAAAQSEAVAKQRKQQAEANKNEINREKSESLDQANPAAQAAERMTAQAKEQLNHIEQQLKGMAEQSATMEALNASTEATQSAERTQAEITKQTESAAEQLERAARHEERLGKHAAAQALKQAADSVDKNAVASAAEAHQVVEAASTEKAKSAVANQKVAEASARIQAEAERISGVINQTSPLASPDSEPITDSPSATPSGQPSSPASAAPAANSPEARARQLAQTLDELDQGMAENAESSKNAGPSQSGEEQSAEGQASEQGVSSESAQAASDSKSGPGQSPSAGEMSPTVKAAMQQQAQNMAKQRQSQVNAAQQGHKPNPSESMPSSSPNSESVASSNGIADSESIDTKNQDRTGSSWGQLRQRRTDDANEPETSLGAPEYQQQIEAYFQAVARRAAEKASTPER
ncbi:hypothetical protein Pla52o_16540 [Novipirellula galeiformis]|uniref:Uncharacterized protein n=1 Tax=Novipirellula galeiformis TaxID=2528004 RepID=A0A5C6CKE3_9BACT|nr:hypothetical protein [Novipirellula galeiformis]TWU25353.1 hypothetical protein Pla52o_16540 [Novipirellula galeiformis]